MKIKLNNEKYRLEIYETLSIFMPTEDIEITFDDTDKGIIVDTKGDISVSYIEDGKIKYCLVKRDEEIKLDKYFTYKMAVKYTIIEFFKKFFHKEAPWGVLTGIRPVKVVRNLMEEKSEIETMEYLEKSLLINEENARLSIDVSKIQEDIISHIKRNSYSVYVNIPFCTGRCSYCSYSTLILEKNGDKVKPYIEALIKEMKSLKKSFSDNPSTIYIGGGTPTSLKGEDLSKLLSEMGKIFDLESLEEFTVEAGREDSLTKEKLKILKDNHVTRLSLNPQSFKEETLEKIGRKQDNKNLVKMYYLAREMDFSCINMDLIIGLPDENLNDFNNTLGVIKKLNPDNLTVHTLAIKKGSKIMQEKSVKKDYSEAEKMMRCALEFSKEEGYFPYYLYRQKRILGNLENIGFAKINKICRYNVYMMEEVQNVLGVGMGSSSKFLKENGLIENHRNYLNMRDYLNKLDEIIVEKEKLIEKGSRSKKDNKISD